MLEDLLREAGWAHAYPQLQSGEMTDKQLEAGLIEAVKLTRRPPMQLAALKSALKLLQGA